MHLDTTPYRLALARRLVDAAAHYGCEVSVWRRKHPKVDPPHSAHGGSMPDALTVVVDRYARSEALRLDARVRSFACAACGFPTISNAGQHEICWFCHWEDDGAGHTAVDVPSGPNHGLTLRRAAACVLAHNVALVPEAPLSPQEYFGEGAVRARGRLNLLMSRGLLEGFSGDLRTDINEARSELNSAIYGAYLTGDHPFGENPFENEPI